MLSTGRFSDSSGRSGSEIKRVGVVMAVISCVIFIVMMDDNFKSRVIKATIIIMLVLAFGGDHYIFDLIWGRGAWIQLK